MKKDFGSWHRVKEVLNGRQAIPYFHEREIWFASIGLNIGSEQDGRNEFFERPILIIRKFSQTLFLAIPLTTKEKTGRFYFPFWVGQLKNFAILTQVRLYDSRRLSRKIVVLEEKKFAQIKNAIKSLL